MRQFSKIDPETMDKDPRIVDKSPIPNDFGNPFYLLIDGEHALLATHCYYTSPRHDNKSEWLGYQLEFPKAGLPWFVDTIENKFFKKEADGGLPAGRLNYYEKVDGEELGCGRCFGLGGYDERKSGYEFITVDRRDEDLISKSYNFTDDVLFEKGLFDWFKKNAELIRQGKL